MKLHLIPMLMLAASTVLHAQTKPNASANLGVYTADMYYEEAEREWKPVQKNETTAAPAPINVQAQTVQAPAITQPQAVVPPTIIQPQAVQPPTPVMTNTVAVPVVAANIPDDDDKYNYQYKNIEEKKEVRLANIPNVVFFPEGFTMRVPENTYNIIRKNGKYSFYHKEIPDQSANFEVYVTNFDLQKSLPQNNHFCISKNKNLGMYIVYSVDKKTNTKDILGFRLFYTLPIDENTYVTVRSTLFSSYELNKLYVDDVVNLNYANAYYTSK